MQDLRKQIEKHIIELSTKRDAITRQLKIYVSIMAVIDLELTGKKSTKLAREEKTKPPSRVAISLLSHGEVTSEKLAAKTGQSLKNAGQTLWSLGNIGRAKRVRPGVYVAGKS